MIAARPRAGDGELAAERPRRVRGEAGLDRVGVAGLAVSLGVFRAWRLALAQLAGALAPGETVLVPGAGDVGGQIAVQGAKLLGAGRMVASARDADALEHKRPKPAVCPVRPRKPAIYGRKCSLAPSEGLGPSYTRATGRTPAANAFLAAAQEIADALGWRAA